MYLRSRQLFALTAIVAALSVSPAISQNATGLDRRPAQVTRGEPGRPLFAMPGAAPSDITAGYLRSRGRSDAMLATLRTKRSDAGANGVTHLRLEQEVDGLAVHGAYVKAAVNARGELVHVVDRLAAGHGIDAESHRRARGVAGGDGAGASGAGCRTSAEARVQGNVITFDGGRVLPLPRPTVTAVAVPMDDGSLARGLLVETWTARKNLLHHTLVDGDGACSRSSSAPRTTATTSSSRIRSRARRPSSAARRRAARSRRPAGSAAGTQIDDQHHRQQRQRVPRRRRQQPARHAAARRSPTATS